MPDISGSEHIKALLANEPGVLLKEALALSDGDLRQLEFDVRALLIRASDYATAIARAYEERGDSVTAQTNTDRARLAERAASENP